jgi:hypothetical protein
MGEVNGRCRDQGERECHSWRNLTVASISVDRDFMFQTGSATTALLSFLYAITDRDGAFTIPDQLAECFRWRVSRFTAARRELVRSGYIDVVKLAHRKRSAVYCWA